MNKGKVSIEVSNPQWGISGYIVPKTLNYLRKSAIITPEHKSRKKNLMKPDPVKYSPTLKKTQDLYWRPTNGKFYSSKKISFFEEQANRSQSNPGPGSYLNEKNASKLNSTLGRFDKCEKLSFLTTVESYAEETPSCWTYELKEKPHSKSLRWVKPKPEKPKKLEIGPGKYAEGLNLALSKTMNTSPKYSFPKSTRNKPKQRQSTPGVGSYREADKAYLKYSMKKVKAAVIFAHKIPSFTESVIKQSAGVPGPGSYNIGPPIFISK